MLKISVLSISLLTIMAGAAVAPGLAAIAQSFPDTDETVIKLILTLPSLIIIPVSFAVGRIVKYVSKKRVLMAGLILYAVGGAGGGLVSTMEMLLFSRVVLGVSVGLIMPLSTALIADLFDPEERAKLMGLASSSAYLGGIIATLAAGFLAVYGWRYPFSVYGFSVLVILLIMVYLPDTGREKSVSKMEKLPLEVYIYAAGAFGIMLIFYIIPANIAMYIERNGFGDASTAGFAISMATAAGFVSGLLFKYVYRYTGRMLVPFAVFLSGTGVLLLHMAESIVWVMYGTAFIGLGNGLTFPAIYIGVANAAGSGRSVQAMGVVTSFLFLGQFLSPVVMDAIGGMLGDSSFDNVSRIAALILYGFAAAFAVKVFLFKNSRSEKPA